MRRLLLLPSLVAVVVQLALPALHALHELGPIHEPAAHQCSATTPDQDAEHRDRHGHDESHCPTCQLFASLRAYTPQGECVTLLHLDAVECGRTAAPLTSIVHHIELTSACPRGPPSFC